MNMARRSGASARTQALAKAAEAVARRDAERIEREKRLQDALADFYHAQAEVERIHAAAVAAAAPFDGSIRKAVRALEELGETRAGIAGLTGLSTSRVREYLVGPATEGVIADASVDGAAADVRRGSSAAMGCEPEQPRQV